jgi:hypothetical protein
MIALREGEKRDAIVAVRRVLGTGAYILSNAEYRILTAARAAVAGYGWAAATWDSSAGQLYALFDSTVSALATPGIYYVQLRGTIGSELYEAEVTVRVVEAGP